MASPAPASSRIVEIKPGARIKQGAQYVAGQQWFTMQPRALPSTVDNTQRHQLSTETIEQMLHDPDVYAGIMLIVLMALSENIIVKPALMPDEQKAAATPDAGTDAQQPANDPAQTQPANDTGTVPAESSTTTPPVDARVQLAQDVADYIEREIKRIPSFKAVLFQMVFEGLAHGNKIGEKVYDIAKRGADAGRWVIKELCPLPRESVAFVADPFNHVVGFLGAQPGMGMVMHGGLAPVDPALVIEPDKFFWFTYRPKDNSPIGQTIFDASHNGWDLKRRTWPEYLLFLMVAAIPGVLATLGKDADDQIIYEDDNVTPKRDADGEIVKVSASQFLLLLMQKIRNHQMLVAPEGTTFTLLEASTQGDAFGKAIRMFGGEITKGMLLQELATRDAEHQTKGSTGTQFTVVDHIIFWVRDIVAEMLKYRVFQYGVRQNFGDEAADELMPDMSLGDTEARDWAQDANAAAALADKLSESQWEHVTSQLGIPPPTDAERQLKALMQKALLQKPVDNGNGNDGGAGDGKPGKPASGGASAGEESEGADNGS